MYREYLINGLKENREYFVMMVKSHELTREQKEALCRGEEVTSKDGVTFMIKNTEGI